MIGQAANQLFGEAGITSRVWAYLATAGQATVESIQPWAEFGVTGLVGFLFVMILRFVLKQHTAQMTENTLAIHTNSLLLLQLQKDLLRHDAKIRQVPRLAGEAAIEEAQAALEVYERMSIEIESLSKSIRDRMQQVTIRNQLS